MLGVRLAEARGCWAPCAPRVQWMPSIGGSPWTVRSSTGPGAFGPWSAAVAPRAPDPKATARRVHRSMRTPLEYVDRGRRVVMARGGALQEAAGGHPRRERAARDGRWAMLPVAGPMLPLPSQRRNAVARGIPPFR